MQIQIPACKNNFQWALEMIWYTVVTKSKERKGKENYMSLFCKLDGIAKSSTFSLACLSWLGILLYLLKLNKSPKTDCAKYEKYVPLFPWILKIHLRYKGGPYLTQSVHALWGNLPCMLNQNKSNKRLRLLLSHSV